MAGSRSSVALCRILAIPSNRPGKDLFSLGMDCAGGWRVLPYMGHIGMCGPKGYGFSAFLVISKVPILVKQGMVFEFGCVFN